MEFFQSEISIFLNLNKIYTTEIFPHFRCFFFCVSNKKIFIKKIWGHRLSF